MNSPNINNSLNNSMNNTIIKKEEQDQIILNEEEEKNKQIEKAVEKLLSLRDKSSNLLLIDKISIDYILNTIEKEHFTSLQNSFNVNGKRGVTIIEFIKIFLDLNEFKNEDNLFYMMGLIDLYQQIQQNMREDRNILFSDITDFHYEFYQGEEINNYKIATYKMPPQKILDADFKHQREIDIDPPLIIGKHNQGVLRLNPDTLKFDSLKHRSDNNIKGIYAQEIGQMITLDSLSGQLNLYTSNAQIHSVLKPKTFCAEMTTIILSFTYSRIEQRIGACLKDFTLIFWEMSDGFKFSKQFPTVQYLEHYSSDIWYLEQSRKWITTNKTNQIHIWNLIDESLEDTIPTDKIIKGSIIHVLELTQIRLVAIASADKQITIWNFYSKSMILTLPLTNSGIHNMIYSYNYQILLTAGFEQIIYLFSIHPKYYEYKQEGRLIGHTSMVTALQEISNTEMVASADDQGVIKIWDIRTQSCLQTLKLFIKSTINSIVYLEDKHQLCILSSRVGFINFDLKSHQEGDNVKDGDKINLDYPINVDFDQKKQELVVCTTKDLRIYNGESGKIKKIVKGITREQSEMTSFNFINQGTQIIVSDDKGSNTLIQYANPTNSFKLHGHQGEITQTRVDFKNKQLITSGKDSQLIIQKIMKNGQNEIKRTFKNSHFGKGIYSMEFSFYHNIIVTGSDTNQIFVYDYEYLKCIGSIILPNNSVPTCLHIINGYSILIVSTADAFIYIIQIILTDSKLQFTIIGVIDLIQSQRNTYQHFSSLSQTYFAPISQGNTTKNGFDYTNYSNFKESPNLIYSSSVQRNSPNRQNQKSFRLQNPFSQQQSDNSPQKSTKNIHLYQKDDTKLEPVDHAIKVVANVISDNNISLYIGRINGQIEYYDLTKLIVDNQITVKESYESQKKNFNPCRNTQEVFKEFSEKADENKFIITNALSIHNELHLKQFLELCKFKIKLIKSINAHKGSLVQVKTISLNRINYIVSCSTDGYFKIWDLQLNSQGSTNVDHPLPMTWELKLSQFNQLQKRFYFTIKTLEVMCKKYEKEKIYNRLIGTRLRIEQLMQNSIQSSTTANNNKQQNTFLITQQPESNKFQKRKNSQSLDLHLNLSELQNQDNMNKSPLNKIVTMKHFYTPQDMQFHKIKDQLQNKLRGPSLKQMDAIKRIKELKTKGIGFEQSGQDKSEDTDLEIEKKMREQEDRENVLFLLPSYKDKVLKKNKEEFNEATQLQKKLDAQQLYLDRQLSKQNSMQTLTRLQQSQSQYFTKQPNDEQLPIQFQPNQLRQKQQSKEQLDGKINSTNIQQESFLEQNNGKLNQNMTNSYYQGSFISNQQQNQYRKTQQQISLPALSLFNTTTQTPYNSQQQLQSQQQINLNQGNQTMNNMLISNLQKQMNLSQFQNSIQVKSSYTGNSKGGSNRSNNRAFSDFFSYASQKNLYQEGSSRFQNQLNELSTNQNSKYPDLQELSFSLKDENFLDGNSPQLDQNQASKLQIQNKVQLLKRMEERSKLNDIIKNLNAKLISSKHLSQKKLSSQQIFDTLEKKNSQTNFMNLYQRNDNVSFKSPPSQNSSGLILKGQIQSIDSFKIPSNSLSTSNKRISSNHKLRKLQLSTKSQNPSIIVSQNNLSMI